MDFDVIPFQNLQSVLNYEPCTKLRVDDRKSHIRYFKDYLEELGARTIVVEEKYIDRDFLEDFANYYVRCFQPYRHICKRLHFFSFEFDSEGFQTVLQQREESLLERLTENYLGFIVVKPLPVTIIGRTCLKTYASGGSSGRRFFPVTRRYEPNLFGIDLHIETLAFQEQDKVVAACATSALWSAFQATAAQFQHSILSPGEITKAACNHSPHKNRVFPNEGLTVEQMAGAIRSVGLEASLIEVIAGEPLDDLKRVIYAYLRGNFPLILGFSLIDMTSCGLHKDVGGHAVTVTGYSVAGNSSSNCSDFSSLAHDIDKIYVHDDQVGPFARMHFDGVLVLRSQEEGERETLSTSWGGEKDRHRALPFVVMIPLYHKVRIPFTRVEEVVKRFDLVINKLRSKNPVLLPTRFKWDIHLTRLADLREDIFKKNKLDGAVRQDILTRPMPRFLWRATAYAEEEKVLDLLFDATDIEQGNFFVAAIEYDSTLSVLLRIISQSQNLEEEVGTKPEWKIFAWFRKMGGEE